MPINLKNELYLQILFYFLSYIGGILKWYIFIIVFGLIAVMTTGTELEKLLVGIFSITPGIGLGKGGNFSVNQNSVLLFILVWGAIFTLFSEVVNKFTKVKIHLGRKVLVLFGVVLHVISLVVFSFRFGFSFAVLFIGVLFTTFLLSGFFLGKINLYKRAINKFQ